MLEARRDQVLQLLMASPAGRSALEIASELEPSVSQPTIWRLLDELKRDGLVVAYGRARATRYLATDQADPAEIRSRRLHEVAARRLARDPGLRDIARERLQKLRVVNPHGRVYHDQWQELLEGPLPRLLRVMTEESERSTALRKESPLTVLVTPDERRRIFDSIRRA